MDEEQEKLEVFPPFLEQSHKKFWRASTPYGIVIPSAAEEPFVSHAAAEIFGSGGRYAKPAFDFIG